MRRKRGFTVIELLVTVGIVAVLATVVLAATGSVRRKARDSRRKLELAQIGRFMAGGSCYSPDGGPGTYDLADLFGELTARYPQAKAMIPRVPRDPNGGSDERTLYSYILSDDGKNCALFANLENGGGTRHPKGNQRTDSREGDRGAGGNRGRTQ
ncbi:type II secretion system protein [Candidatus Uhrbacteria bacterium]|nr:type II secretion system protein [Candidatus Uhrbacteria bacterium]